MPIGVFINWSQYQDDIVCWFNEGFRARDIRNKIEEVHHVSFKKGTVEGIIRRWQKNGVLPPVKYMLCDICGQKCRARGNRQRWCSKCVGDDKKTRHQYYVYDLTPGQYDQMMKDQNGFCKICEKRFDESKTKRKVYVDHDHVTGKVRGLLCPKCNSGLGYLDQPGWLAKAQQYLAAG